MPAGRPSIKTPELLDAIVERIAAGESLRSVCRDDAMPGMTTVFGWLADDEQFRSKYARARDAQAEVMDDKIVSLAERVEQGDMDPQAARVAIGAYQWRAAKLAPKRYGDKVEHEHTGPNGGPVQTNLVVTFGAND